MLKNALHPLLTASRAGQTQGGGGPVASVCSLDRVELEWISELLLVLGRQGAQAGEMWFEGCMGESTIKPESRIEAQAQAQEQEQTQDQALKQDQIRVKVDADLGSGPDRETQAAGLGRTGGPSAPLLFLVVLGGRCEGCHIELHDVRFVIGARIEDTFAQLRQQWFGRRRGLHIDSWVAVRRVAGWGVELRREPSAGPERLWFVNRGGYDPGELAEQHSFGLVVASSAPLAKVRARSLRGPGVVQHHTDDLHAVDDCLPLTLLEGWHVHLSADTDSATATASVPAQPLLPDWFGYRRIDRG